MKTWSLFPAGPLPQINSSAFLAKSAGWLGLWPPSLFVYSLKPREAGLLSHLLTRCVALNKPLDHSGLLFSPARN